MRRGRIAGAIATLGLATLLAAGCTTAQQSRRTSDATTPQDKTHQEQLANLSRQDAQDARDAQAGARKPTASRRPSSGRRTGQKIVDQPVRR